MRNAKIDSNQSKVVQDLRKLGYYVLHTHTLKNCCDLFIAKSGRWCAVELKDSSKMPKKFWFMTEAEQDGYLLNKLTDGEMKFYLECNADYIVDCTAERIDNKFRNLK